MESRAVGLIGRKQRAAKLLYGDNDVGLSELTGGGDDANDLIAELAKSLDADEDVTDLRDLFKAASHDESQRESLWAATGQEPEPELVEAVFDEPSILVEDWPQREFEPIPLPPKPERKRRSKVRLSDPPLPAEHQHIPRLPVTAQPVYQQLSLFD